MYVRYWSWTPGQTWRGWQRTGYSNIEMKANVCSKSPSSKFHWLKFASVCSLWVFGYILLHFQEGGVQHFMAVSWHPICDFSDIYSIYPTPDVIFLPGSPPPPHVFNIWQTPRPMIFFILTPSPHDFLIGERSTPPPPQCIFKWNSPHYRCSKISEIS